MSEYISTGTFTLPSHGKVYDVPVSETFTVRNMTVNDEARRLNPSDRQFKVMADIIDDCLTEKIGISAYDLCLGDYIYVLHRLRVVTYGNEYSFSNICPFCGSTNDEKINLSDLEVFECPEDIHKYFEFDLPVTKKHIKIKMQTPRMLDDITVKANDLRKRSSDKHSDPAFFIGLEKIIDEVDNEKPNQILIEQFVRQLPMADANTILAYSDELNRKVGINMQLDCSCDVCGLDYKSSFRTTTEFYRPTIHF